MSVQLQGLERIQRIIGQLASTAFRTQLLQAAGYDLQEYIAWYPQQQHFPQPFKSDRQRRHFFWMLANGMINVPYRRGQAPQNPGAKGSERLKQSWWMKLSGRTLILGNDTTYAGWVQDRTKQSAYHRQQGHRTIQDAVEVRGPMIEDKMAAEARRVLGGGGVTAGSMGGG